MKFFIVTIILLFSVLNNSTLIAATVLGTGSGSLLGNDLTDPEDNGVDSGTNGSNGTNGSDGSPLGISVSYASSIQCTSPVGGLVFEVFLDTDLDGIKDVGEARSGETVTTFLDPATEALDGYLDPKPMVFCGLFPIDGDDFENLRESLQRLKLNDASITYEPESSGALGFGFRCGFLGLLHMEIVKERLEREFNLALIATAPSVEYMVHRTDGQVLKVDNPADLPLPNYIASIEEPFFRVSIITPKEYTGSLMELCQERRGELIKLEYLSPERVDMQYTMPLAEVVVDFFDQLKSRSQGYASLDYELAGYRPSDLVRVDILLNALPADAFSTIVHRDKAYNYGNRMCGKLRELIPRQMFDVPIQAAIGGRIIARETVKARRKDVLAKCYGGDISRKRKLLEKQKEGKKKMKSIGRVEVPGDVFISALKLDD